jgi:hypothetical protein
MTKVYVLQHEHVADDGTEDVKLIGVYSSQDNAQAAIERLRQVPGFSEAPDGFHLDEYQVDMDHWVEGYVTVAGV